MAPNYYACLTTHHLLDHKPDNLLRTGHKHGLVGVYKFGTPGIAVAWGTSHSLESFFETLKSAMPQKKFSFTFQKEYDSPLPLTAWTEMDSAASLKEVLRSVGVEDDYYTILGIDKRETTDTNVATKKSSKGKKKKK